MAGFLYWVGASTVAYVALRASYSLFRVFRVWCVGNEAWVGPRLGAWAGEWNAGGHPGAARSRAARARRASFRSAETCLGPESGGGTRGSALRARRACPVEAVLSGRPESGALSAPGGFCLSLE